MRRFNRVDPPGRFLSMHAVPQYLQSPTPSYLLFDASDLQSRSWQQLANRGHGIVTVHCIFDFRLDRLKLIYDTASRNPVPILALSASSWFGPASQRQRAPDCDPFDVAV
jgi:hypothetical protein